MALKPTFENRKATCNKLSPRKNYFSGQYFPEIQEKEIAIDQTIPPPIQEFQQNKANIAVRCEKDREFHEIVLDDITYSASKIQ